MKRIPTADIYRSILSRTSARYMTVRPDGVELSPEQEPLEILHVQILEHAGARTLYRNRKPLCRSLDAVTSVTNPRLHCATCFQRRQCTPQVRLELLFEHRPWRLLLAYTSAKNFLLYNTAIINQRRELAEVITEIRVVNRGSWGELRFSSASSSEPGEVSTD
jgi:hypothetical protein